MGMNDFPLFKVMMNQMRWLVKRQQGIVQNLNNVNTPKYRAHDVRAMAFKELVKPQKNASIKTTHAAHIAPKLAANPLKTKTYKSGRAEDMSPSGNDVNLETTLSNLDETRQHYQLISQLYKKNTELLKIGLGSGSGH